MLLGCAFVEAVAALPLEQQQEQESAIRSPLLGRAEAQLREEFGAGLQSRPIEKRPILNPGAVVLAPAGVAVGGAAEELATDTEHPASAKDPFAGQRRLTRKPDAIDIHRIDYELYRGRVYRVRWHLAARFERPLMSSLVSHLTTQLGKPYYDQLVEGKFGTGRATLRRAGWRNGAQILEIRQLNPRVGGPVFLTLSDQATIQTIAQSGGTAAPEPDSIGPWWQKPVKPFASLGAAERDALLVAFDGVLAEADWK